MDIHRIISRTTPISSQSSTSSSPNDGNQSPTMPAEAGEEQQKKDRNEVNSDRSLQPKNIKLVKYTPTNNTWQRESGESLPATPIKWAERTQKSSGRSQPLKVLGPDSTPLKISTKNSTKEANIKTSNDKLLSLLRSKSTMGNFHNVTLNKNEMVSAPKCNTNTKPEFISSNNSARIRTLAQKKETIKEESRKSSSNSKYSINRSPVPTWLRETKNQNSLANQNISFASNVRELLQKKENEKSRSSSSENNNKADQSVAKIDTIETQAPYVSINNENGKHIGGTSTMFVLSSKRKRKQAKEVESMKFIGPSNGIEDKGSKRSFPVTSNEAIGESNSSMHISRDDSATSPDVQNVVPSIAAAQGSSENIQSPSDSTGGKESQMIPFENKDHEDNSVIVQTMGQERAVTNTPSEAASNQNHQLLASLKTKWEEVVKADDKASAQRRQKLAKLYANVINSEFSEEELSTEALNKLDTSCKEEPNDLKELVLKDSPDVTGKANYQERPINFRPTIILTRQQVEKNNINQQEQRESKEIVVEANSPEFKRKYEPSIDPIVRSFPFASQKDAIQNDEPAINSARMELVYVTDEDNSSSDDEETNTTEKMMRSRGVKAHPLRFRKNRLLRRNPHAALSFTSLRRDVPVGSDPEAERRKFNREFPLSVMNKLKDQNRYGRDTISDLVQAGVPPHRALSGNSDVSATNDVCSAVNYEQSHAYYHQQIQKRGKLEYLNYDSMLSQEYRDAGQLQAQAAQPSSFESNISISTNSSPGKMNTKSDTQAVSKEDWANEWRSKLKSCTIYFDTLAVLSLEVPRREEIKKQIEFFKRIFQVDFSVKIADTLNDQVDLMIISKTPGHVDDSVPFSETVTNAIPGSDSTRKLRVWNHAKVWQFVQNLGVELHDGMKIFEDRKDVSRENLKLGLVVENNDVQDTQSAPFVEGEKISPSESNTKKIDTEFEEHLHDVNAKVAEEERHTSLSGAIPLGKKDNDRNAAAVLPSIQSQEFYKSVSDTSQSKLKQSKEGDKDASSNAATNNIEEEDKARSQKAELKESEPKHISTTQRQRADLLENGNNGAIDNGQANRLKLVENHGGLESIAESRKSALPATEPKRADKNRKERLQEAQTKQREFQVKPHEEQKKPASRKSEEKQIADLKSAKAKIKQRDVLKKAAFNFGETRRQVSKQIDTRIIQTRNSGIADVDVEPKASKNALKKSHARAPARKAVKSNETRKSAKIISDKPYRKQVALGEKRLVAPAIGGASIEKKKPRNSSDEEIGIGDDVSYLEHLLENASLLLITKDKEIEAAKKIILRLSQEIMHKELKITSLEGQLKSAQNNIESNETTLQDYKTMLTERELEIFALKKQSDRDLQKKRKGVDNDDGSHRVKRKSTRE